MEFMKEKFKKAWERIRRSLTPANIALFILVLLLMLLVSAVIVWIFGKLLDFLLMNIHLVLLCGTIIGCFAYWMHSRNKTKREMAERQKREQDVLDEAREQQSLENSYQILKKIMYLVLNDSCHITTLPRVSSLSALEAPTHFVKANGFYTFLYLVAKGSSTMDFENLKDILNTRLAQGLNAQEFDGITQKIFCHSSGRTYQLICIHKILDLGSYLQLNVCFAGRAYADFVERSFVVEQQPQTSSYDIDF